MIETFWFCMLGFMLATYVVLDGFDMGAGILHLFVAKNASERNQVIRSVGPVWDGNEVWLLAAGGTMFFSFPVLLATALSGFYLPIMMLLWLILLRAIGIELHHYLKDPLWGKLWDVAFGIASLLMAIFFGAALGNVVRGVPLDADGVFFEPLWTDFRVGDKTGILDWYTVLVAVAAAVTLAYHGALWLIDRTDAAVQQRSKRVASALWPLVLLLAIAITAASFFVNPMIPAHVSARPWGLVFPVLAFLSLVASLLWVRQDKTRRAFYASCAYLYAMLATVAVAVYPYVLPARNPAHALTMTETAAISSSLITALYWWIPGMLIVVGYMGYMYSHLPAKFSVNEKE